MTDSDTNHRRYLRAAHAVQTGVGLELEHDPASGTPKHLRTGLNLSKAEHGALVRLLIARGAVHGGGVSGGDCGRGRSRAVRL